MSLQIQIQIQMNMWHFFTFKFRNSSHSLNELSHREKPLSCPPSTSIKQLLLGRLIIDWHVLLYICTASVVEMCKCMCIFFPRFNTKHFLFHSNDHQPSEQNVFIFAYCCVSVVQLCKCTELWSMSKSAKVQVLSKYCTKFHTALYCVWREVWLCRDFPQS